MSRPRTDDPPSTGPQLSSSALDLLLIELVPLSFRIVNELAARGAEEDDEGVREAVFHRLDAQGYRVGQALAERFSPSTPRPSSPLDSIKFVCRDLWGAMYKKQIDNLKTNHRGTFVLTDARFPPLARMSADRKLGPRAAELALTRAQPFLWFHCGVVRGALNALGMDVVVNAETQELPIAVFQVRVVGSKP
ncbi:hypothetical protein ANO11243_088900 [Dothideomycetidae sp. 11243]|nr:hypothetical protein ANO11243_088900 [fungal sp. No.11243]